MPIQFPIFQKTLCENLTACARIKTKDKALLRLFSRKKEWIARYRTPSGSAYTRILITNKPSRHLHVDCALAGCFPKGNAPTTTKKKSEIAQFLEHFIGIDVDVRVSGFFKVPFNRLPEEGLIRILFTEHKTVGTSIRLTGATMSITGMPIEEISWSINQKKKEVELILAGSKADTINSNYLPRLLEWIEQQLHISILSEGTDAKIKA